MKAPAAVLKHLGIAAHLTETSRVLQAWADRVVRIRHLVPLTSDNQPVVPSFFCP